MKIKLFFLLVIVLMLSIFSTSMIPTVASNTNKTPTEVEKATSSTWTATDNLGRTIADNTQTGNVKQDKYVGLFYWNWHDSGWRESELAVNNSTIIEAFNDENMWRDATHPAWSWEYMNHSWHEPVYGYYLSTDTWVLRKHAEVLADAGVDVIFFDCSNDTHLFDNSLDAIFRTFQQAYDDGVNVPKISFLLNFGSNDARRTQLENLYSRYYREGLYSDTWFIYEGKPLILGDTTFSSSYEYYDEIKDFFNSFRYLFVFF